MLQRRRTCGVWRKVRVAGRRPCSLLGAWARAARSVCGLWRARSALSPPGRRGSKAVYHCCVTITSEGGLHTCNRWYESVWEALAACGVAVVRPTSLHPGRHVSFLLNAVRGAPATVSGCGDARVAPSLPPTGREFSFFDLIVKFFFRSLA